MFTWNTKEIICNLDIENRIYELKTDMEIFQEGNNLEEYPGYNECLEKSKWFEWDESEEGYELVKLEEFVEELYGELGGILYIVKETYFTEWAENFAYSVGVVQPGSHMEDYINWDAYAEDLKGSFHKIKLDGVTYLVEES